MPNITEIAPPKFTGWIRPWPRIVSQRLRNNHCRPCKDYGFAAILLSLTFKIR